MARVASIEHGLGLDDELLARMHEAGLFLVPVLSPSDQQTRQDARGLIANYRASVSRR